MNNTNKFKKPPIGIEPEYIWKQKRYEELCKAIGRYVIYGMDVPFEWVNESKKLLVDLEKTE